MKKTTIRTAAMAVLALILALAMAGCQSAEPATQKDPAETVGAVMQQFMDANVDQLPALLEADEETLRQLYGIEPEWVTAYDCRISMMNVHATEFFVAHVAQGHMDDVKAAIEARQAALETSWGRYLPAQYELVKDSETVVVGDYVLYAVTEHTDSIREIFEKTVQ